MKMQDDVEAEMRRLKLELQKTMDMYSTACKEALTAKQKVGSYTFSFFFFLYFFVSVTFNCLNCINCRLWSFISGEWKKSDD